jgi:uncharacterized protein (TIGR02996 family)
MTANEAFLQAILEDPDDDTPRLVYADWLEERGDPRGEFIRTQCRLARLASGDPSCWELRQHLERLWLAHGETWLQPLRDALGERSLSLQDVFYGSVGVPQGGPPLCVDRGFLEGVSMTADHFLKVAEALLRLTPICKAVLYEARDHLPALAESPCLARLTALGAHGVPHECRGEFSACEPGPDWSAPIGSGGAQALAASPHLGRLTALDLGWNEIDDAGAQALAACPGLSRLSELDLSGNRVGHAGAQALASSPHLGRLSKLNLAGNFIGYAGARALVRSSQLTCLTGLDLSTNAISPQGLRALAGNPFPARLSVRGLGRWEQGRWRRGG